MTEDHDWYARYRRRVELKRIVRSFAGGRIFWALPPEFKNWQSLRRYAKAYRRMTP